MIKFELLLLVLVLSFYAGNEEWPQKYEVAPLLGEIMAVVDGLSEAHVQQALHQISEQDRHWLAREIIAWYHSLIKANQPPTAGTRRHERAASTSRPKQTMEQDHT